MQAYSRIALKVAIGALGVAVLTSWFTTKGTYATRLASPQQQPQVITVCPEGPPRCQFSKIQQAIDAAPDPKGPFWEPTAEIQVAPGTYEENLLIIFKVVELKGAGKDRVFLRLPKGERKTLPVILIVGLLPGGALIEGFTIQGSIVLVGFAAGAHIRRNNLIGGIFVNGSLYSAPFEENDFQGDECGIGALNVGKIQILRNTFQDKCGIQINQARLNIFGREFKEPGDRIWIEGNQGGEIWIMDSAAIAVLNNTVRHIKLLESETAVVKENLVRLGSGMQIHDSSDVVIQKNLVEGNTVGIIITGDPFRILTKGVSVAIIGNRVVRNDWGIVTEKLEYVTVCQGNEVKENKQGDYGVGWFNPNPSPELKQKCEGG